MTVKNNILTADKGTVLTNGKAFGKTVRLGKNGSVQSRWQITEAEHEKNTKGENGGKQVKRILAVLFVIMMAFCMTSVCFATEIGFDATELELYITEKIVPVVAGVLTSIVALISLLRSIAKSLKGLKDTKSAFELEAEKRETSFKNNTVLLESKTQEIKEIVNTVPQLQAQLSQLEKEVSALVYECGVLAKIMSLGFSANSEIVKSGKGKKMSLLIESLNQGSNEEIGEGENEKT